MNARRFFRVLVLVVFLSVFVFAADVVAHGPPWPIIDGFFEPLWEDGKSFNLWRGGDPTKPVDGGGWALWDRDLPENGPRDLYVAVWMNSKVTNISFEENWIRANDKNGLILVFEEFAWFDEGGQLVGWESRVEVPSNVCLIYVHTVTGPNGVETAGGSFDICDPTALTLNSFEEDGSSVALVLAVSFTLVVALLFGLLRWVSHPRGKN